MGILIEYESPATCEECAAMYDAADWPSCPRCRVSELEDNALRTGVRAADSNASSAPRQLCDGCNAPMPGPHLAGEPVCRVTTTTEERSSEASAVSTGQVRIKADRSERIKVFGAYGCGSRGRLFAVSVPNSLNLRSANGLSEADIIEGYPSIEYQEQWTNDATSRVKPGASSDVRALQRRVHELESAIGSATKHVCSIALELLPQDADADRKFVSEVRDRLEKAMDHDITVWPENPPAQRTDKAQPLPQNQAYDFAELARDFMTLIGEGEYRGAAIAKLASMFADVANTARADGASQCPDAVLDAHRENVAIRRAYLHERQRATAACNELRTYDEQTTAKIESQAYRDVRGLGLDYPLVPLLEGLVLTNGGQRCDMAIGPCACGATHDARERRPWHTAWSDQRSANPRVK